ncbi:MAG TPA: hypothetical protein VMV77_10905 [Bacteroidales bacterium]|nr:hypothetical protein [Bacteroidales bacterium]
MKNIIKLISKVIKSIRDYEYAQKFLKAFLLKNAEKTVKIRIPYKQLLMLNYLAYIGITNVDELEERLKS